MSKTSSKTKVNANATSQSRSSGAKSTSKKTGEDKQELVSQQSKDVSPDRALQQRSTKPGKMLIPKGYTMREVQPAKNYDVISFARAMNADFGPRVKKLFEVEKEAALEAAQTGVYVGWRCPEFKWDCQRVGRSSKCFCGHLLSEHDRYNGRSVRVPCKQGGCTCKAFIWIPSRPEEIGEFWFQRRRDFDPSAWRAKCRCKHTHEEHDPTGMHRCRKCGCGAFNSNFLCAACDKHWELHETFFETSEDRKQNGLPTGPDYLPFAEIPSLRNMVLTGEDDGDMSYMKMQEAIAELPSNKPTSNTTVVPYNQPDARGPSGVHGNRSGNHDSSGGFRPVYD